MSTHRPDNDQQFQRVLDISIRIGVLVILGAWCFDIVKPFIVPIVWGIIIAVASQPLYHGIETQMGGRRAIAATVFTLLALLVLITPTVIENPEQARIVTKEYAKKFKGLKPINTNRKTEQEDEEE